MTELLASILRTATIAVCLFALGMLIATSERLGASLRDGRDGLAKARACVRLGEAGLILTIVATLIQFYGDGFTWRLWVVGPSATLLIYGLARLEREWRKAR